MRELSQIDRVASVLHRRIALYARILDESLGATVVSLTIFGDAIAAVFDPERKTIRSAILVPEVDLSALRRLAACGERLGRERIAAPLVMTPAYLSGSVDSFPLELLEIQQRRAVLWGDDYFADLKLDQADVRLQCERELKRILLGMRQGLLASGGDPRRVESLERDAAEILSRTLRGLLWLRGTTTWTPLDDLSGKVEKLVGRELPGLRDALDDNSVLGWLQFDQLYNDVKTLAEMVDVW
ncbi:MAG: hypothetical protein AABZ12_00780 [Planctomycetota bacterium]